MSLITKDQSLADFDEKNFDELFSNVGAESAPRVEWRTSVEPRDQVRRRSTRIVWGMAGCDLAVMAITTLLAARYRDAIDWFVAGGTVGPAAVLMVLVWLVCLARCGAYRIRNIGVGVIDYRTILHGSLIAMGLTGAGAYLLDASISRGFFLLTYAIGVPALLVDRWIHRRILFVLHRRRRIRRSVIVAGDATHVADVIQVFKRERWLGYDVVGVLTPNMMPCLQYPNIPAVGMLENVLDVARSSDVGTIVFAEGSFSRSHMFDRLAAKLEAENIELIVVPALSDIAPQRMTMRPVAGMPLMYIDKPSTHSYSQVAKRICDIVFSSLLILLSLPVIAVTALAIKIEDGGPIIFKQQRIGIGGKPFECYKIRSMVTNAAEIKERLIAQHQNESEGDVLFKMKKDPRITKVGGFIRRFSVDELPQFFNVLKGDMSLVGPRPALKSEVDKYEQHVRRRLDVRPGITGLWQVSGRSDLSWADTVRLDLYYVNNWSLVQDLSILLKTFKAVFSSSGAY
ncbi:Bacterial sugar transferase [Propionibacterium ruminifibrarum]|uniref:Bacterial sugar transferase n=1 Tax=Propionibacterium ruminifibrarum TaxID=1962131 RepID=A0A375I6A7_9ACTN|nr:sugar transferase [Propionibacterium ruminifibrarum]SPF68783.1 Bacterial sugar transferase [Propionibacterium ruminifibrarum]